MLKAVLADDAMIVVKSLAASVAWKDAGFELAGTASDGAVVMELARDLHADLVIADIRMPLLDGLSLAERIRIELPSTRVIIITGFSEIEYARRAILAGASDFILKPIDNREFENALRRVAAAIEGDRVQAPPKAEIAEPSRAQALAEARARLDLLSLVMGLERGDGSEHGLDDFLGFRPAKAAIVRAERACRSSPPLAPIAEEIRGHGRGRALLELVDHRGLTVFVLYGQAFCGDASEDLHNLASQLSATLSRRDSDPQVVGIGRLADFSRAEELRASKDEAYLIAEDLRFMRSGKGPSLVRSSTESGLADADIADGIAAIAEATGEFERSIASDRENTSDDYVDPIDALVESVRSLAKRYLGMGAKPIRDLLKDAAIACWRHDPASTPSGEPRRQPEALCAAMDGTDCIDGALNLLREYALDVRRRRMETEETRYGPLTRRAMEYIRAEYMEDIGLEAAAAECSVSPSHLSRVLAKEAGAGFTELLNRTRVAQAIRYLTTTTMKVYEVADRVGFDNPAYFNQVFRRVTGASPREYVKKAK